MSSHHYIYRTILQPFDSFLCLLCSTESGKRLDIDRIVLHSLDKCIHMLFCKNGCRNKICNLLSILNCFKRRTNCHLGFSKSNITADESIHDPRAFHITFCIFYGMKLIFRLLVRKQLLKFLLPHRVRRVGKAAAVLPHRVQPHQLLRHLFQMDKILPYLEDILHLPVIFYLVHLM